MPEITRLVQGKKNPSRVNLYLDDSFAFALSIDEVGRNGLKKGMVLSEEQIMSLKDNDQADYVYAKILNFLSFRPRTVKEVSDRLKKYEVNDLDKQNLVIAKLKDKGYLDDVAFSRWFIESRNAHHPRSPRMLAQELMQKGVGRDDISFVIADAQREEISIHQILDKKLGTSRSLETLEKQKIYTYLGRQGYTWEKIKAVVKTWESE